MRYLSLLFCFAVIGCGGGPETVPVSGKITLDNEPLPNVVVTFRPNGAGKEDVYTSTGTTNEAGEYSLNVISVDKEQKGAVIGTHQVSIARNLAVDESAEDADVAITTKQVSLPPHDFTFEVKEATDQANFNLESSS